MTNPLGTNSVFCNFQTGTVIMTFFFLSFFSWSQAKFWIVGNFFIPWEHLLSRAYFLFCLHLVINNARVSGNAKSSCLQESFIHFVYEEPFELR